MMLSLEEARKKGIRACMERIGFEFCLKNQENACTSYSDEEDKVFCFVGIDDKAHYESNPGKLVLSNVKGFPYSAGCNVYKANGEIEFIAL